MSRPAEPILSPEEEQEKWLEEAKSQVKQQAFLMKRSLDKGLLTEGLKYSAAMLSELRTSLLSPKTYYELYMIICDELRYLESYFSEEHAKGTRIEELYEIVQHAGNIVPRLYLLITVGSVYIKSKEAPAKDILKDLVEMTKGVQHPTRGLFLRNYLSQISKDKLPDKGSEYEGVGGNVSDAVDFVYQNFNEMLHLWVRMQNQGLTRDREKRERERLELRVLVGTNLVRLSQLDGVELSTYTTQVLPRVLDALIRCKDQIAQQYLLEVIIQVFPDEFHLATLETYLAACLEVQPGVDLKSVFISMMDRLANYAAQNPTLIPNSVDMVKLFTTYLEKTVQKQTSLDLSGVLAIQKSLLNLSLRCYSENLDYVNAILGFCAEQTIRFREKITVDASAIKSLLDILTTPLEHYKNVLTVVQVPRYLEAMNVLPFRERRALAIEITKNALKYEHTIDAPESAEKLFEYIRPLVKDEDDQASTMIDDEDFQEEQNLVARLVHLLDNEDTDVLFKIFRITRKHFGQGGTRRLNFTLVPMVFAYLRLAIRISHRVAEGQEVAVTPEKVFQYILEIMSKFLEVVPNHELCVKLYLQSAQVADQCALDNMCYECLSRGFEVYEDVSDSKVQLQLLNIMTSTIHSLRNLSDENYDTLSAKTCQYAVKLLKKPDQCRAAVTCSHLFWLNHRDPAVISFHNPARVLECLQRSLKIADSCLPTQQSALFVEILNRYLYHFDQKNEKILVKYISGLIDLINTHLQTHGTEAEATTAEEGLPSVNMFYQNTLKHIQEKKAQAASGTVDVPYGDIDM